MHSRMCEAELYVGIQTDIFTLFSMTYQFEYSKYRN